jgi:hypothetical protein
MLVSEKLAIAAHLHVLLRRKTGRVTDTEWMAQNAAYAVEIVRFARAKAREDNHPDLANGPASSKQAVLQPSPTTPKPLAQAALQAFRSRPAPPPRPCPARARRPSSRPSRAFPSPRLDPTRAPRGPDSPRYVGGIR